MLKAFWSALITLFLLSGCAQMPGGTSTGDADHDRLHNAIAIDDVGYVEDIVRARKIGVNQSISTPAYREGAPILLIAARYGAVRTLRYLISAGADLNTQAATGETALMMASYFADDGGGGARSSRHEEAVRLLVEAGASLENAPYHYTPLGYAAYKGHDRIVRYLLERGARVDGDVQEGTSYVNTPLMMASIQGHLDTALWLLRAGANAKVRIYLGNTAAELAQKYRHANLANVLKCAEGLAPSEKFSPQRCGR